LGRQHRSEKTLVFEHLQLATETSSLYLLVGDSF
jgi:hypothetical protein